MNVNAPLDELVSAPEFEAAAAQKLDPITFAEIAGGNRSAFDRITFRPRMMVNTLQLDLSLDLLGTRLFAPIIVGPIAGERRFHPEGELATMHGASAARTAVVISSRSSYPISQIATQSKTTLWYQIGPDPEAASRAEEALTAGCKAIFLTLGSSKEQVTDWKTIDRLRSTIRAPLVLKGIMRPEEAKAAAQNGISAIVVSSYTGHGDAALPMPIEILPAIADAVGGRIPILIDGSFRRGSDILKALALGARAVLLGRPPVWALSAYGSAGVQRLLELLINELARDMAMCGKPNLQSIDTAVVKLHRR